MWMDLWKTVSQLEKKTPGHDTIRKVLHELFVGQRVRFWSFSFLVHCVVKLWRSMLWFMKHWMKYCVVTGRLGFSLVPKSIQTTNRAFVGTIFSGGLIQIWGYCEWFEQQMVCEIKSKRSTECLFSFIAGTDTIYQISDIEIILKAAVSVIFFFRQLLKSPVFQQDLVSNPPLMQQKRKYMFWYHSPLYPIRTEGRIRLFWYLQQQWRNTESYRFHDPGDGL